MVLVDIKYKYQCKLHIVPDVIFITQIGRVALKNSFRKTQFFSKGTNQVVLRAKCSIAVGPLDQYFDILAIALALRQDLRITNPNIK